MSLVLLGRAGETKVVTNLGTEITIQVLEVRNGRVLLDVSTMETVNSQAIDLPVFFRKQTD